MAFAKRFAAGATICRRSDHRIRAWHQHWSPGAGGALVLHHPFDGEVLERQINDHACDALVAPVSGITVRRRGMLSAMPALRNVIGLWRAPGAGCIKFGFGRRPDYMTDIYLFGEVGLFAPGVATMARPRRSFRGLTARRAPSPVLPSQVIFC